MRRSWALAVLVLALPAPAWGGAWTRDAGAGYVKLGYASIQADEFYDRDGETIPSGDYSQHSVEFYAEVGLLERFLTLSLDGVAYRWNALDGQGSSEGPGDLRLGLWSGLLVAPFRLSAGVLAGLPTGDARERIGTRSFPPGRDIPPGIAVESFPAGISPNLPNGDGEFDLELRLALGSELSGLRELTGLAHFLELELGFWWREEFEEAITYSLKLGTRLPEGPLERVWLVVSLFGVESFAEEEDVETVLTGLGDGVTFTGFAFEVSWGVWEGLELSFRLDGALRARALPAAPRVGVAVAYTF